MAYQTVTHNSYGSRVKKSAGGVGTGFLMLIAGIILLFWNEGRTVKTTRTIKEVDKLAVEMPDITTVNPEFEGKVIHAIGEAKTDDILTDSYFGISRNAIKLSATPEYYQYVEQKHEEHKDKVGGGEEVITTYTYEKQWVYSRQNSSSFADPDYQNANNRPSVYPEMDSQSLQAQNVSFGAYRLPASLIGQMSNSQPFEVTVSDEKLAEINNYAKKLYNDPTNDYISVSNNVIYIGRSASAPEIGDMRITFTEVLPGEVSIISKVVGDTFEAYHSDKNDKDFNVLTEGNHSKESMIATAKSNNKMLAWALRILGIILLYAGFKGIFGILDTLAKVLPFLSSIVGLGTSIVAGVLAIALGLVIIAIAWIWYRPLLGILLLAIVVALIWFFTKKGKEKKAQKAAEEAAAAAAAPAPEAPEAPAE